MARFRGSGTSYNGFSENFLGDGKIFGTARQRWQRNRIAQQRGDDDPILAILRAQLNVATITSRKTTGVGFFTDFGVPNSVERTEPSGFVIGDVYANFRELINEVGFLLFIKNGTLSLLEGFACAEEWPSEPCLVEAHYVHHEPADSPMLRRCTVRDFKQLRANWNGAQAD